MPKSNIIMKILIVAPSRKMGGIERALSVLANEWAIQNFEVVYVSCLKSEPFYALNAKIKVVEPTFKRSGGLLNKLFFYPKLVNYIRAEIKSHQPDRILSFGDFFNSLVLLAAKGLKIPIYISDRTSADFKFPFYIKFLKQKMYPQATGFIAQTQRAFDAKLIQFGSNFRQVVIPNAIRAVEKMVIEREKIILYAGRFSWEKNPVALINAYAQIENKENWKLVMAGDGSQLKEMKEKVKELKIEKSVVFLGAVAQLDEWLNKASIFVLPSVLEGFPNALAEAMTAGLPVICFDSIAYESIINPGIDGEVIPFEKIDLMSKKIEQLMFNENLRLQLGMEASLKAKNWTVQKTMIQYNNFLELGNDL
jgi:glycosyltransferase involved in cell wall biosynthesis